MPQSMQTVNRVVARFRELHKSDKPVIAAVSGGVDSAALIWCLSKTKVKVTPAFVFHGIRSKSEEQKSLKAARIAAKKCNMPQVIVCNEPGKKILSKSTEEKARNERYSRLSQVAGENGTIVTAHHADDQLETMLMRLCRGSSIHGLSGIPASSSLPVQTETHGCRLLRPMLGVTKEECIEICRDAGLSWHEDVTNKDPNLSRNRIRLQVVPVLKDLYPTAAEKASIVADQLREASEAIEQQAADLKKHQKSSDHRISMDISFIESHSDAVAGAWLKAAATRLMKGSGADSINNRMIRQVVLAAKSPKDMRDPKVVKHFNWGKVQVTVDYKKSFIVVEKNQLNESRGSLWD